VACQSGVCYYSPEPLEDKAAPIKMGNYDTLSDTDKKEVIKTIEQEYLASLFLNNSNGKMHSYLKKDVANNNSKGTTNAYPPDIHKVLTLMNEYKPLKLGCPCTGDCLCHWWSGWQEEKQGVKEVLKGGRVECTQP
jgi:hypothetical protein